QLAQHSTLGILFFAAAIAVIGMPPLSGFIGKLFILEAARTGAQVALLWPIVLGTTFLVMIALSRAGSRMFWHVLEGKPGEVKHPWTQLSAIVFLVGCSIALTLFAQPLAELTEQIAYDLMNPSYYIDAVLGQPGGSHE
ncbi:monovalent cation/H+ antiporter subunit D, partial [Pseudidiomarina aestuarii]